MRSQCGVMPNIGWFLTDTTSTSEGGSAGTRAVGPVLSTSASVLRWGAAVSMAAGSLGVESFDEILSPLFPYGKFKRKCLRTSSLLFITIKEQKYKACIYLDRCWLSNKLFRCNNLSGGGSDGSHRLDSSEYRSKIEITVQSFLQDSKIKIRSHRWYFAKELWWGRTCAN